MTDTAERLLEARPYDLFAVPVVTDNLGAAPARAESWWKARCGRSTP